MVTPVKYTGTSKPFFETSITGGQASWMPGQIRDRSDADAALLIASGNFSVSLSNSVDANADPVDGNSGVGAVSGGGNSALLPFQLADSYAIGATPPDYELDLTSTITLPSGVTSTSASLSSRGAYVSSSNQAISIALGTVLPSLTATAWTVEVEFELDTAYVTDSNRSVFEFGGTTNNRHVLQIVQSNGGIQNCGYANLSTVPGLDVKTSQNLINGLSRANRVLSACSGTAAAMWFGASKIFSPNNLQAVSGTLSLNLGITKSTGSDFLYGWIRKVRVWQSVVTAARQRAGAPIYTNDITCWGDSLTQGAGASPASLCFPSQLSKRLSRNVYNRGISGETSTQIRDRFLGEAERVRTPGVTIIWAGRNNPTAATVAADVDAIVSRLGGSPYLVLNVLNKADGTENAGSAQYIAITGTNAALAAAYPNNYVAVRERIVSLSGGANDAPAAAATADGLHLTGTYYGYVADMVRDAITSRGW